MADVELSFDFDTNQAVRGARRIQDEVKATTRTASRLGNAFQVALGNLGAQAVSAALANIKKLGKEVADLSEQLEVDEFKIKRNLGNVTSEQIKKATREVAGFNRSTRVASAIIADVSGEGSQTLETVVALGKSALDLNDYLGRSQNNADRLANSLNEIAKRFQIGPERAALLTADVATTGQIEPEEFAGLVTRLREVPFEPEQIAAIIAVGKEFGHASRQLTSFFSSFFEGVARTENEAIKAAMATGDLADVLAAVSEQSGKDKKVFTDFGESLRVLRDLSSREGLSLLEENIARGVTSPEEFKRQVENFQNTRLSGREAAAAAVERSISGGGASTITRIISDVFAGMTRDFSRLISGVTGQVPAPFAEGEAVTQFGTIEMQRGQLKALKNIDRANQ